MSGNVIIERTLVAFIQKGTKTQSHPGLEPGSRKANSIVSGRKFKLRFLLFRDVKSDPHLRDLWNEIL